MVAPKPQKKKAFYQHLVFKIKEMAYAPLKNKKINHEDECEGEKGANGGRKRRYWSKR
jgi:hypothetical protein